MEEDLQTHQPTLFKKGKKDTNFVHRDIFYSPIPEFLVVHRSDGISRFSPDESNPACSIDFASCRLHRTGTFRARLLGVLVNKSIKEMR